MIVTKISKRYASALFQQAREEKVLDAVSGDMRMIRQSISESRNLLLFLKSQIISREIKRKVLEELFEKHLSEVSRLFLALILNKRREDQLPGITAAFDVLYKKELGLIDIEVMVVSRPDPDQDQALRKALESRTGKKVQLFFTEDSSLKGGMAVRIGDTVIDGTVKHKLQQIETRFHQQAGM